MAVVVAEEATGDGSAATAGSPGSPHTSLVTPASRQRETAQRRPVRQKTACFASVLRPAPCCGAGRMLADVM